MSVAESADDLWPDREMRGYVKLLMHLLIGLQDDRRVLAECCFGDRLLQLGERNKSRFNGLTS